MNKWSKVGPVCDFVLPGLLLHQILVKCLDSLRSVVDAERKDAFGAGAIEECADAGASRDEATIAGCSFAVLQGARYRTALGFLKAVDTAQVEW